MGIDPKKVKDEKAAAEKAAEKERKKAEKEKKKARKKTPWKARQVMRVGRASKTLAKLSAVLTAAKAPGVDSTLCQNAFLAVGTLSAQLAMLADTWKPERGHAPATSKRLGIGSVVQVKADLNRDEIKLFKHMPAELFKGATIVDDGQRDWFVKCADGATRLLRKKFTQRVDQTAVTAQAAT